MGKRGPVQRNGRRTGSSALPPMSGDFKPSTYLSPLAKKVWKQVVAAFPPGYFSERDRILFEQYCTAAATHRELTALLDALPSRYVTDNYGRTSPHPATKDQSRARCDCAMLATKLRITNQSRVSPWIAGRKVFDGDRSAKAGNSFAEFMDFDTMLAEVTGDEQ